MMIMSSPTQLLGPAAITTGEGLPSADNGEQSEQDFADLLAAAFTPITAPNAPALLADGAGAEVPAGIASGTSLPTAAYSLAITSDNQPDFRSFWSLPLQSELTSQAPPVPLVSSTTLAILPDAALVQAEALQVDVSLTPQFTLAQQDTPPNPVATAFAQYLPLGNQNAQLTLTEPHEAGKSFSLTELSRSNEMPARAARVVKDIVTEPEAIEPTSQASETRNFTEPEAAAEPLLPEQAEAPPTPDGETTFMTQAQSAAAATTVAGKGAPPPIATQAIHPLVELAHQTAQRETRSLRFDLHPKELGRVEVEVSRDAAGNVSATLNAEHADAAQALNHSLGHLREALEQAGVKVEQLHVFTSAQFQQQPNGQPHQQQSERATPLEALLLEPATEESSTEVEADKLLNLRA